MNVWISANGLKETPFVFPYQAQNPSSGEVVEFNNEEDVQRVIDEILIEGSRVSEGQNLYFLTPLFCDQSQFIDAECQDYIRQYNFCQKYNVPLAQSFDEIPAHQIEAFEIIEQEMQNVARANDGR